MTEESVVVVATSNSSTNNANCKSSLPLQETSSSTEANNIADKDNSKTTNNTKKYGLFKVTPKSIKIDSRVELLSGGEDISSPKDSLYPNNINTTNNGGIIKSNSITMSNNTSNNTTISPSTTTFTMSSSHSALLIPEPLTQESSRLEPLSANDRTATTSSATTITTTTTTTCSNGATLNGVQVIRKQRWRRCRERLLCAGVILMSAVSAALLFTLLADKLWKKEPPQEVCQTPACLRAASRLLDKMDRTVSPCDDFYQFTCGNYLKQNIVPDDFPSRSAMQEMKEDVLVIIKKMLDLEVPENDTDNESDAIGKARRLYHSCMNTSFTVQEKDMADSPIFDLLTKEQLGEWPILSDDTWDDNQYDLEKLIAQLTIYQVFNFIDIYITNDEKNSSMYTLQFYRGTPFLARSYYLNQSNEDYIGYMAAYRALLKETVTALAGDSNINSSHIDDLIAFEVKFATISDSRVCVGDLGSNSTNSTNSDPLSITPGTEDEEDSIRMTVSELNALRPEINWSRMLKETVHEFDDLTLDVDNMIVTLNCDDFVVELVQLLSSTPKRVITNYLIWRFLLKYLPYISNHFQQLWQQFRSEVPHPFEERNYLTRWKECATVVNGGFGAALARMYIAQYYDMTVSAEVDDMVEEVRGAFDTVIKRQDWLQDDMKEVCTEKLYLMGKKIGFPEYIQSVDLLDNEFEGLDILEDHFLNNILRIRRHEIWKELQKLSRPVDKKKDWAMQPLIVNAFHNPSANEIILPLGILREPFYNPGYPMYINYGSLGVVIGHELVHGFDNHGKRYDKHGNVSQWWSDHMAEQFMERAACFIEQYSQYPIEMVGKNVDGNETLGDNISDNTGLLNAWLAYQRWEEKHGVEPQLPGLNYTLQQIFFITFGQIWCEVVSKEGYEKYSTDVHSPGVYRTNGVAQNSQFFSDTWGCPKGSSMNPEKKCLLWT